MKRILLASVAALGLAGTASAADLAVKAPVVVPAFTWTGCYLGVNGGWIGGDDSYLTEPWGSYLPGGVNALTPQQRAETTHGYGGDKSAGTLGGQFGCQVQLGGIVIGGEWDAAWSGLQENYSFIGLQNPSWAGAGNVPATVAFGTRDEYLYKSVDWFTTARVRLGFAWDRVLIYATGGFAMAAYDSWTQVAFPTTTVPDYWGAYREKRLGYAVGGGLEWAFTNNWTAKAEFLYLDFGSFSYISTANGGALAANAPTWNTSIDAKEYVARIGINYLFHTGAAPVMARY